SARIWQHGNAAGPPLARDENLRGIRCIGRKRWKRECGYHRRSLAETTMFWVKTIFGNHVRTRLFEVQGAELLIRCVALNRVTH
ncbi:MAG TPA: IS5/IS1182 family transposase, partial [Gammaproteobacteria bacterium]|nr:IS5/IS1182 family transposase [Gammaproteobacteria bacterium]